MKTGGKKQKSKKLSQQLLTSAIFCIASSAPAWANGMHAHNGDFRANKNNGFAHGADQLRRNLVSNQIGNRPAPSAMPTSGLARHIGLGRGQLRNLNKDLVGRFTTKNQMDLLNLDLSSNAPSIILNSINLRDGESTIVIGDTSHTFKNGDHVTASEFLAIQQSESKHGQSIKLDANGVAIGGTFSLNEVVTGRDYAIGDLTIPEDVQANAFASRKSDLSISGNLINYGTLSETSKGRRAEFLLSAQNISNHDGAVITSISRGKGTVDIELNAAQDFTNLGTIESSGALSISAGNTFWNDGSVSGGTNLVFNANRVDNSGRLESISGDLSINGGDANQMSVTNYGGTLSAQNGTISFNNQGRDVANVLGGDLLSKRVLLNSGEGTIDVNVNKLTGEVESSGSAVHVQASTDTLRLGSQCLIGDPTYYNDSGDILITGDIVVGEDIAIIASGNITSTAALTQIVARDGITGVGYDVTMVAGANVTGTGGASASIPPGTAAVSASFSGASTTGGDIDLSLATNLVIRTDSNSTNGGRITLAAYEGTGGGHVTLPSDSVLDSSGISLLAILDGTITIVAPNGISIGEIANSLGVSPTGRSVFIASQPTFTTGAVMSFDSTGSVVSGNYITGDFSNLRNGFISFGGAINGPAVYAVTNGSISFQNDINASAGVCVAAGGDITLAGDMISFGGIALLSSRDILSPNSISLRSLSGPPVALNNSMILIAGTNFSASSGTISITGPSAGGGSIALPNATIAGLTNIYALNGSGTAGFVDLSNGAVNGNTTIIAEAESGTGISISNVGTTSNFDGFRFYTAKAVFPPSAVLDVLNPSMSSFAVTAGTRTSSDINLGSASLPNTVGPGLIQSGRDIVTGPLANAGTPPFSGTLILDADGDININGAISTNGLAIMSRNDIHIGANLSSTGSLLVVAGRNIDTTVAGLSIGTGFHPLAGPMFDITIAAGAAYFQSLSDVSITGGSATGGFIDFQTNPIVSLQAANNLYTGTINLAAYSGSNNTGYIRVNTPGLTIATTTNVNIVGGQSGGTSIEAANVQTFQAGNINLAAGTPGVFTGSLGPNAGAIISGGIAASSLNASDIIAGNLVSPGGSVSIETAGSVQLGSIDVSNGSNANGGTVLIQESGSTPLLIGGSSSNSIASINAGGGSVSGDAGAITIINDSGTGISVLSSNSIDLSAPFGKGGYLEINAAAGDLDLANIPLSVNGGAGNSDGGTLILEAGSLVGDGSSPIQLTTNGSGSGNGGTVSITIGDTTPIIVGNQIDQFQLSARSGLLGGNGGTVIVSTGGDLTVDPSSINASPMVSGGGATIRLEAGRSGPGNLLISGSLNAAGIGSGDGGVIELRSNSSTPLIIGNKKSVNGITGQLDVTGTNDGTIEIANDNGDISLVTTLERVGTAIFSSDGAGSIVLKKALGAAQTSLAQLIVNGTGNISSLKLITASTVDLQNQGSGGIFAKREKQPLKISSGAVAATSQGLVNVQNTSTSSVQLNAGSSANSSFSFTSAGDVVVNSLISGADVVSLSSGKNGSLLLNDGVQSTNLNGVVNIFANGTGTITNSAGVFSIQGFEVNLSTGTGDLGAVNPNELRISAENLSAMTFGNVYLTNSGSATLNVNNVNSRGDFCLRSSVSGIALNTPLKNASVIDLATGGGATSDVTLNSGIGGNKTNAVTISANLGDIKQSKSKSKIIASGTIELGSTAGDIGSASLEIVTDAPTLAVNSSNQGNDVFVRSERNGTVNLLASHASTGRFNLSTTRGVTLNDLDAASVNIVNNSGLLMTKTGTAITATDGGITLQSNGKKGLLIELAGDLSSFSTVKAGGQINILVGDIPNPLVPGTAPSGVITNTVGTGAIFFNNGIIAMGANNVTAINTNVVFSSGSAGAAAIQLDGGVDIVADPPLNAVPESAGAEVLDLSSRSLSEPRSKSSLSTTSLSDRSSQSGFLLANPSQVDSNDWRQSFSWGRSIDWLGKSTIALLSTDSAEYLRQNQFLAESAVTCLRGKNGFKDADRIEITAAVMLGDADDLSTLEKGSVVIASPRDSRLETKFGNVFISANSIAVIVSCQNGLSVYNLHDTHRNAVMIRSCDTEFAVSPGHCLFITNDSVRSFEQVNPSRLIAYRHITDRLHGNGVKTFRAQFSLPTAIHAVKPLREMMMSNSPQANRIAHRLLKTTSILLQLHASGEPFQRIIDPEIAAYVAQ